MPLNSKNSHKWLGFGSSGAFEAVEAFVLGENAAETFQPLDCETPKIVDFPRLC